MISFKAGPADGVTLMLRRAPIFLRVVGQGGKFDALDQLDDQPDPREQIFVYVLVDQPSSVHVNMGRKGGGWFKFGTYRFLEEQPSDEQMRTTDAWRKWTLEKAKP